MEEPPRRVCAICGRTLATLRPDDGSETQYMHEIQDVPADHMAVPVEPGSLQDRPRCDFCNVDLGGEHYVLPVRSFEYGNMPAGSLGDWAACPDCARVLEQGRWSDLLRRGVAGWEQRHGGPMDPLMRESLRRMYGMVRRNVVGPVRNASS